MLVVGCFSKYFESISPHIDVRIEELCNEGDTRYVGTREQIRRGTILHTDEEQRNRHYFLIRLEEIKLPGVNLTVTLWAN